MRIHDERGEGSGTATVSTRNRNAWVHYTVSNQNQPLCLWCSVGRGSLTALTMPVVEALCQRESPVVLVVESENTELRFTPKYSRLMRCWTHGNQSVFAESFSSREAFNRVCSLSYAMQRTDFVRVNGEAVDLFGYHSVLGKIREQVKPFEFLNIKEDCDYSIKGASARCVDKITTAALASVGELSPANRARFEESLHGIASKQLAENGYDTRYSYIHELAAGILLPALVLHGAAHPFTRSVFSVFSESAGEYVEACEGFLREWREIDEEFS